MDEMSITYEALFRQSTMSADELLGAAVHRIDELGLKRDPRVIAAYMRAASADFALMVEAKHLDDGH
jgi:hypothetical protein